MPSAIVIRLVPTKPISGDAFTGYLATSDGSNVLIINAYDVSFNDPNGTAALGNMTPIGSAIQVPEVPFLFSGTTSPILIPAQTTGIVQHRQSSPLVPPAPTPFVWAMQSVATAVIVITAPPAHEYVTPDVIIELRWGSPTNPAAAQLISRFSIGYNVAVTTLPDPFPPTEATPPDPTFLVNTFENIPPSAVAAYVPLVDPSTLSFNSTDATVTLPSDGSPPNFQDLRTAVNIVIAQDPGLPPDPTNLTPAQARDIAFEIAWNRHLNPLPTPPTSDSLEDMYTVSSAAGTPSNDDNNARAQFEGSLAAYSATNNANGEALAKYVFSLSAALAAAAKSAADTDAQLTFPVIPGPAPSPPPTGTFTDVTVDLENP